MTPPPLWLTGNPVADELLAADDNALLLGMVLDQQVPMEKAFAGPAVIAERMGGRLDVAAIAAMDEEEFVALCSSRPAVHRFPWAMAKRVRQVCRVLVSDHDGDACRPRDQAGGQGREQGCREQDCPGPWRLSAGCRTLQKARDSGAQVILRTFGPQEFVFKHHSTLAGLEKFPRSKIRVSLK